MWRADAPPCCLPSLPSSVPSLISVSVPVSVLFPLSLCLPCELCPGLPPACPPPPFPLPTVARWKFRFSIEPSTSPATLFLLPPVIPATANLTWAHHAIVLLIKHSQGPLPGHICIELSDQVWPRCLGVGGPNGAGGSASSHTCQSFSVGAQCPCE